MEDPVVIVGTARTPQGKFLGALKDVSTTELGSVAIKAAMERAHIQPNEVTEVLMGCVLPAGLGQAPARQAALRAGLPKSTACTTINKMCGSGMKAVMLAHDMLIANPEYIIIAGGMESMSNAPYLLHRAREGYRLGHAPLIDHMMLDGLEDAYDKGKAMGVFAEQCAKEYNFSRADQDGYAIISLERAQKAIQEKTFLAEIAPVMVKTKQGEIKIENDEHPTTVKMEKIPQLPPAFSPDGTVTAANSSSISDGAAALVLMRHSEATRHKLQPMVKILGHSTHAKSPSEFTTAPIDAIRHLLQKLNWTVADVDLFEINEAFAVVAMAAMQDLKIPREKLNIHGSGCALGHPIGATGARILVTLIAALKKYGLKRGIAALCIGGGEATAVAVEVI